MTMYIVREVTESVDDQRVSKRKTVVMKSADQNPKARDTLCKVTAEVNPVVPTRRGSEIRICQSSDRVADLLVLPTDSSYNVKYSCRNAGVWRTVR